MISEVLSLEDGLRLVSHRAQLLSDHCSPGSTGMLAVSAAESTVTRLISNSEEWKGLGIACDNNPSSCVVGGTVEKLKTFKQALSNNGTKCSLLNIPFAYHTEHLGSIATKLTEEAQNIALRPAKTPVVLNAIGAVLGAGEQLPNADYFARHSQHKVRFTEGIADAQAKFPSLRDALFIEIGPHASTLPMIRTQVNNSNASFIPSLEKGAQSAAAVVKMLVKVFELGIRVSWRQYFEDLIVKPRLISAPGMPFQEVDYIIPYMESKHTEIHSDPSSGTKLAKKEPLPYRFLCCAIHTPPKELDAVAKYETDIKVIDAHITGHKVCDVPLCPASVFQELALSATTHWVGALPKAKSMIVENVVFAKPLVTTPDCSKVILTHIKQVDHTAQLFHFEILSKEPQSSVETSHCSGSVKLQSYGTATARTERFLAETEKIKARIESSTSQILSRRTIYDRIFSRVVAYSSLYQSIDSLKMGSAVDECIAECTYPPSNTSSTSDRVYVADPVFMDTLIHTAGFLCNSSAEDDEIYIGHSVEEACLFRSSFDANFEVRCVNVSLKQGNTCIGDAIAIDSNGVIAVIRGIQLQKVQLSRMSKALSQAIAPASRLEPAKNSKPNVSQSAKAMPVPVMESMSEPRSSTESSYQTTPIDYEEAIIEIIAEAGNAPKSSINPSMSLDELGIDSLLMIEMEASFRKLGPNQLTSVDFEKCVKVADIVQLLNPSQSSIPPTAVKDPDMLVRPVQRSRNPASAIVNHQDEVLDVISQSCNTPKTSISMSTPLDALGIDSLLMLEIEKPLRQIGSNQFTAVDFEKCVTVGDVVSLINSGYGSQELQAKGIKTPNIAVPLPPAKITPPETAPVTPTDITSAVIDTIAKTCRMDSTQVTSTTVLDDLGIDSLMMVELEDKFHELSPNGFKTTDLKDCHTVQDITNVVAGSNSSLVTQNRRTIGLDSTPTGPSPQHNGTTQPPYSKITDPTRRKRIPMDPQTERLLIDRLGLSRQPEPLQSAPPGSQKPAIFLIHAGSGFSRPYYRLSSLVDRDIWAIHDDKLLKQEEIWHSVAHVVQTYADLIRQTTKGGPVIISGWSFGGIVAYEVTKLLQREGKVPVLGLVLVDPPPPDGYTNPRVAELLQRLFVKIFGANSERQSKLGNALHEIAASNAIRCADLMETYVPTASGKAPRTAFLYAVDAVTTDFLAEEGDEHAPYDAWLCEREDRKLALGGWEKLLGEEMKVIDLPGNHYNILERERVHTTSVAYIEACEWIERGGY